jgi:copper transport protein
MRRVLVLLGLVATLALLPTAPALAHATLVASSPAQLDILTSPPSQLMLVFDEEVDATLSRVDVTGPQGLLRHGPLSHDRFGPTYLLTALPADAPAGDYTVVWHVVTRDDGHPASGSFTYRTATAGTTSSPPRAAPAAVVASGSDLLSAVHGAGRWLAFLGFALLVGGAFFLVTCRPGSADVARLVGLGWGVLLLATATVLATYGAHAQGDRWEQVTDLSVLRAGVESRTGHLLVLRIALLCGLALAAGLVARLRTHPPRGGGPAVLAAGGALACTWSVASHSDSSVPLAVLDVVHLVACAVWLGGLVVLGRVVLRERDTPGSRGAARRFSSTAAVCVTVLVLTGSVQAWQRVGTPAALLDNTYAQLLLGKLGLVAATLLLAGVARFRLLRAPRYAAVALRRAVTVEAALAVGVLTVTSVLVTTQPARTAHAAKVAAGRAGSPAQARPASLSTPPLSGSAPYDAGAGIGSRGTVEVSVLSPRPGPTEVHLTVLDAGGRPRAVRELVAALKPPTGAPIHLTLRRLAPGHYVSSGARFSTPGSWRVGVALRLPDGAGALVTVGVTVG